MVQRLLSQRLRSASEYERDKARRNCLGMSQCIVRQCLSVSLFSSHSPPCHFNAVCFVGFEGTRLWYSSCMCLCCPCVCSSLRPFLLPRMAEVHIPGVSWNAARCFLSTLANTYMIVWSCGEFIVVHVNCSGQRYSCRSEAKHDFSSCRVLVF